MFFCATQTPTFFYSITTNLLCEKKKEIEKMKLEIIKLELKDTNLKAENYSEYRYLRNKMISFKREATRLYNLEIKEINEQLESLELCRKVLNLES